MKAIDILESLEQTGGRNDKEDILYSNRHNDLLKHIFIAGLNPYLVYNVKKHKNVQPKTTCDSDVVLEYAIRTVLPILHTRKVTGNAARSLVEDVLKEMDETTQKWFKRVLLKNLRCGVQSSTVNKVWQNLIPEFEIQLANTLKSSFEPSVGVKILERVNYPVRVEPKLDGLRCVVIKVSGAVSMYTRNGTLLDTMQTIKSHVETSIVDNIVLDGEMLANNWNDSSSIMMSRKNSKDDSDLVYHVFDTLTFDEWVKQSSDKTLLERVTVVTDVVLKINSPNIVQVSGIVVNDDKELLNHYNWCMDRGYEGAMVKNLRGSYDFKRSDAVLKLKAMATIEGVIVGCKNGRKGTRFEGVFNTFDVVFTNGKVTGLGSGLNDALRAQVQLDPGSYIRKIVEVSFQPDVETLDGFTKDGKARFPAFKRFRDAADVDVKVIQAGEKWLSEPHNQPSFERE